MHACVCVCMVAWTLTCRSLHMEVREWLPAVGSFLLPCMFEELNLVSGLWQAPWPTELSCWLMECNLTFECFTSLPRRGCTSRTCQWNSDYMALDWSVWGFGAMEGVSVPGTLYRGDLKKEETNNHKGKDIQDPAKPFRARFYALMSSRHLLTTHFFLILLSALT